MKEKVSGSSQVTFEDDNWKIVLVGKGLYLLLPKYKCKIERWELEGSTHAIVTPIINGIEKDIEYEKI